MPSGNALKLSKDRHFLNLFFLFTKIYLYNTDLKVKHKILEKIKKKCINTRNTGKLKKSILNYLYII